MHGVQKISREKMTFKIELSVSVWCASFRTICILACSLSSWCLLRLRRS